MNQISPDEVKKFYDTHEQMWEINNWYKYTHNLIIKYLGNQNIKDFWEVLNAGSGGNSYGITSNMTHLDISPNKLRGIPNSLVGNLNNIKLAQDSFDCIICVGSVINYCHSYKVIENFSSWLVDNGELILEFENSNSFEYLLKKGFGKSISSVSTQYMEDNHKIYIYSLEYIKSLLEVNNFKIIEIEGFHIISSLLLRIGFSENFASYFTFLDIPVKRINFFKRHAGNIIIKCKKIKN